MERGRAVRGNNLNLSLSLRAQRSNPAPRLCPDSKKGNQEVTLDCFVALLLSMNPYRKSLIRHCERSESQ